MPFYDGNADIKSRAILCKVFYTLIHRRFFQPRIVGQGMDLPPLRIGFSVSWHRLSLVSPHPTPWVSSDGTNVVYADLTTSVPIYISGTLFIVAGCLMLLLPYEPRGKTSI